MIARLTATLILCLPLFAAPITIEGLSYVSGEAGQVTGGFTVTDPSGRPMPYLCDSESGITSCTARPPRNVRWIYDYTNDSVEVIDVSAGKLDV